MHAVSANPTDLESPSCPLCNSMHTVPSSQFVDSQWKVRECRHCGLGFVWPLPSDSELQDLYRDYGLIQGAEARALGPSKRSTHLALLIRLESALGRRGSVLDIGCSTGEFLESAQERGWTPYGIEWDERSAEAAAARLGPGIYTGSGSEVLSGLGRFDVITMSHYLEHVVDPFREFRVAVDHLEPGGLLMVRVPNARCIAARAYGSLWGWFSPPFHLFYFDTHSIQLAAQKSGLQTLTSLLWRGDAHTTPVELLLSVFHGIIGSRSYSTLYSMTRDPRRVALPRLLERLDSWTVVNRVFGHIDDSELVAIFRVR